MLVAKCVQAFYKSISTQPVYVLGEAGALFDPEVKDRFFVEAGAYDGSQLSNSLFLEMKHKWTGLLVSGQRWLSFEVLF